MFNYLRLRYLSSLIYRSLFPTLVNASKDFKIQNHVLKIFFKNIRNGPLCIQQ